MTIVAYAAAGFALGLLYFGSLWWNASLLSGGGRLREAFLAMAGRFAVLGGVLAVIAWQGAEPLLAAAAGVFVGRLVAMRRVRSGLA